MDLPPRPRALPEGLSRSPGRSSGPVPASRPAPRQAAEAGFFPCAAFRLALDLPGGFPRPGRWREIGPGLIEAGTGPRRDRRAGGCAATSDRRPASAPDLAQRDSGAAWSEAQAGPENACGFSTLGAPFAEPTMDPSPARKGPDDLGVHHHADLDPPRVIAVAISKL